MDEIIFWFTIIVALSPLWVLLYVSIQLSRKGSKRKRFEWEDPTLYDTAETNMNNANAILENQDDDGCVKVDAESPRIKALFKRIKNTVS